MLLNLIIALLITMMLLAVAAAVLSLLLSLPVSDVINEFLRRIGLSGPSPGTRSAGMRGVGTVTDPFVVHGDERFAVGRVFIHGEAWNAVCPSSLAPALAEGDAVEVVYNDDLTVTVVDKSTQETAIPPPEP